MTLNDLMDALERQDQSAPLIFATDAGPIAGGYHVTEYKRAQVESIDCGGRRDQFEEVTLQLLDGAGERTWMSVGKFLAIAARSRSAVAGLGDAPLKVEFGHQNLTKGIFEMEAPVAGPSGVGIGLREDVALCKPKAERLAAAQTAATAATAMTQSCCGPARAGCC